MFADLTQHPSEPLGDQPDVESGSQGLGFRDEVLGFRFQGLGLRDEVLGFRV